MKKALRKGSATSDEESIVGGVHHHQKHHHRQTSNNNQEDENTDTEQHESLPHDQEDEDNKINTQKQKRDLFPELIKKLRESAKKNQTNNAAIEVQPQKKTPSATESTDDDERVVRERRKSLLRRGINSELEGEAKFDVIDETSSGNKGGGGVIAAAEKQQPKKSKVKSVFTFDVPSPAKDATANSSSDNDGVGKGQQVSPKSPIYATVNKARKSPVDPNDESLKGKFNSFFTIVREAVRRQSIAEQQLDPDALSSLSSVRSPRQPPPPISKRDSDCSIWSDNIPVITISHGSDECILEEDKKASSSSAPSSDGEQRRRVTKRDVQEVPVEFTKEEDVCLQDDDQK